jgi:hypothetical protein
MVIAASPASDLPSPPQIGRSSRLRRLCLHLYPDRHAGRAAGRAHGHVDLQAEGPTVAGAPGPAIGAPMGEEPGRIASSTSRD